MSVFLKREMTTFALLLNLVMKQSVLLSLFVMMVVSVTGQNIQLHYDLGKDRKYPTSTVEFFKPDKYGSTFMFVDMDYNIGDVKGVSSAYWEIARSVSWWEGPLAAHAEYNGGFMQWKADSLSGVVQIDDAWLAGVDYIYNNESFTKGFTLQLLYKYIRNKQNASFQITGVWYLYFLKNKMTFTGFADFWKEDNLFMENSFASETHYVFITEPQLWYNFTPHIAAGTEWEFSNNFGGVKGFQLNPTIGIKWTIE